MHRLRIAVAGLLLTLCASAGTEGLAAGTGTITGRVEIEENSQRNPVRRAAVTLGSDLNKQPRIVATNQDGAYRFDNIPAGSYRVEIYKAGFVEASKTVALTDGESRDASFVVQRAGAVEGRFVQDTGKLLAGLTVDAERLPDNAADRTAIAKYSAKTDDLGRFRIHTLPPGRYRVSALPPPPASGERLFYPGTENPDDAGIISVVSGQTVDGLYVSVAAAQLSAIAAEAIATQELEAASTPPGGGRWAEVSGRVVGT